jgi:benzaldehyde dehydrogenase (NAD)
MSDLSMLINGLKVAAERNATFERRNPLDGTVATRAPACSPADAVMAVEAAAEAFRTWSEAGPNERRMLLLKAADALEAKIPAFIEAVPAETGATGMWAGFNVMPVAGMTREAAALTTQVAGEVIPSDVPGSLAMGLRVPAGVVLGIAPWNAPVILGVRAIATPLACGNADAAGGPGRCRRRRRRQCRGLRLLCQQRPDVHEHRTPDRRPEDRRRLRQEVRRQGQETAADRPAQARAGGQPGLLE